MTFCSNKKHILQKRQKTNLTKHFVPKELRRSDFLIAIEDTYEQKPRFCRPPQEIVNGPNALTFLSFQKQEIVNGPTP